MRLWGVAGGVVVGVVVGTCVVHRDRQPQVAGVPGPVESAVDPEVVELVVEPPSVRMEAADLRLEEQRWRFGEASGVAWRVRVPRDAHLTVVPAEGVVPFEQIVAGWLDGGGPGDESWSMINGGFYEAGQAMGLVVHEGVVVSALSPRGGSGVAFVGADGLARVVHRDAYDPTGVTEAVQSVDRVVDGGKSLVKARPGAPRAARSAVVVAEDAVWLVALAADESISVVDEDTVRLRGTGGRGLPLWAFADYLVAELGAVEALNLDGAISTQLVVGVGEARFEVVGEAGTVNGVGVW